MSDSTEVTLTDCFSPQTRRRVRPFQVLVIAGICAVLLVQVLIYLKMKPADAPTSVAAAPVATPAIAPVELSPAARETLAHARKAHRVVRWHPSLVSYHHTKKAKVSHHRVAKKAHMAGQPYDKPEDEFVGNPDPKHLEAPDRDASEEPVDAGGA